MVSTRAQPRRHGDTHPGKADFVAKVVETTDAVLGVLVVVVLDEPKTATVSAWPWR